MTTDINLLFDHLLISHVRAWSSTVWNSLFQSRVMIFWMNVAHKPSFLNVTWNMHKVSDENAETALAWGPVSFQLHLVAVWVHSIISAHHSAFQSKHLKDNILMTVMPTGIVNGTLNSTAYADKSYFLSFFCTKLVSFIFFSPLRFNFCTGCSWSIKSPWWLFELVNGPCYAALSSHGSNLGDDDFVHQIWAQFPINECIKFQV